MAVGIYAIYWEETGDVYVGQSIELEVRISAHMRALKRRDHANLYLQCLYLKYGVPKVCVLDTCRVSDLNLLEVAWVAEFDGPLNIQEPGVLVGSGTQNPNSRHSKRKILRCFAYLYKYGMSQHAVSKRTGVPRGTLSHIVRGKAHHWLSEEYPKEFQILKNKAISNLNSKKNF